MAPSSPVPGREIATEGPHAARLAPRSSCRASASGPAAREERLDDLTRARVGLPERVMPAALLVIAGGAGEREVLDGVRTSTRPGDDVLDGRRSRERTVRLHHQP